MNIQQKISEELNVSLRNIEATIKLLDEGATVPFIARYRKEITGGLDDTQLRFLNERLVYLRELESRKETILKSIGEQNKLTPELETLIANCDNKTTLEDLYLPYKPKRRTKAQMAREQGLQSLADAILLQQNQTVESLATPFITAEMDEKSALDGARAILIEQFAEDADLLGRLREKLWSEAILTVKVIENKEEVGEKFKDYFNYQEKISTIPSHRALAILRGRNEEILNISLQYQDESASNLEVSDYEKMLAKQFNVDLNHKFLAQTVRLTWKGKIFLSLELEALQKMREQAEDEAIKVFARNLKDLLLAPPAGRLPTLGLDPGLRTGIKVAGVDDTGKLVDTSVVYLHQEHQALQNLSALIKKHEFKLIAIGNGTASRETDKLAGELVRAFPQVKKVVVSEAGASVYSASELAAKEFPHLDVTLRGAVSIARRLQDPLAELVKIEPKAIGVGQYQHDVNQSALAKSLDDVVEDCVNAVGVDVNTASSALLARISGLNQTLAKNIVEYRDTNGAFKNRQELLKVPRLGAKTFEQSAGFLRINDGVEILDSSAVHPEAYDLVKNMLSKQGLNAKEIIGNSEAIKKIKPTDFVTERFGLPTILDILKELEKPARDPRGEFKTANLNDNINEIKDLEIGMILEGTVTNVANFGAFVDIGVHQDGLVHVSMLSDRFVSDPHEVVKAGDVVKVKVLEIDEKRKRISLSMKLGEKSASKSKPIDNKGKNNQPTTALADAFSRLKKK